MGRYVEDLEGVLSSVVQLQGGDGQCEGPFSQTFMLEPRPASVALRLRTRIVPSVSVDVDVDLWVEVSSAQLDGGTLQVSGRIHTAVKSHVSSFLCLHSLSRTDDMMLRWRNKRHSDSDSVCVCV